MNHKSDSTPTETRLQACNAKKALFPASEIHQHAVEIQDRAGDACMLLGIASDLLANLSANSAEFLIVIGNIDCLIRSARRALGQIDEAGAAVSLVLEDAGAAAEGGVL